MTRTPHEDLLTEGVTVSIAKLCAWFGVPRRTVYYKPTKAAPKVDPRFAEPIIDCHTCELLGWHMSCSGKASTASTALEQAPISRFGTLGLVDREFLPRSDNGLVFTSRHFTALVRSYGLKQEFITPHCPQKNGMVERVIRTLKEQCTHRHRFESIQHTTRAIGDWTSFYNHRRPHQALAVRTPAEAFRLAV